MRFIKLILLLIIIAIGITFACLNADPVTINYYFSTNQMPLAFLLVIAFAVGVILGLLIASYYTLKVRGQNMRLQKRIKLAEKEVANLRSIPLKDSH